MNLLRQQMLQDMTVRGLSVATHQAYVHAVAALLKYLSDHWPWDFPRLR